MIITSRQNPRVLDFLKLHQSPGHRRARGLFWVEGWRLVREAALHCEIEALICTEEAAVRYGPELRSIGERAAEWLFVSESVADKLSETQHSQQVFCTAKRRGAPYTPRAGDRLIALENIQDPGNLGAMLRSARAFGLSGAVLLGGCDVTSPKVLRAAMGAAFTVPVAEFGGADELFRLLGAAGIPAAALVVEGGAPVDQRLDLSRGIALCVGNEGNGLSADLTARCDMLLTIPMAADSESLNAAVAASIAMWEVRR